MAESKEELNSLLIKMKESKKARLEINIQKIKITAPYLSFLLEMLLIFLTRETLNIYCKWNYLFHQNNSIGL